MLKDVYNFTPNSYWEIELIHFTQTYLGIFLGDNYRSSPQNNN